MSNEHVPFLDLVTPHREMEAELVDAFRQALQSAAFVGGAQVEAFEREFADYCGVSHSVGVGSGTDAVRFALMASGVGPGDAVVTVAHTFIATVEGICQAGASPEFVDIDPRTYSMSPDALEQYLRGCPRDRATRRPLGKRTRKPIKAVLPVHLYGQIADMDAILSIAAHYNLLVIEDACQAHGAEYLSDDRWHRAGSFGTAAAFSFYPGKNLGACGEGGAVTTNDEQVAKTVRMLRDHGQAQKYHHELEGYNGRLDAIQAAILRVKLPHLDEWNMQRREAAATYTALFAGAPGIVAPFELRNSRPNYHLYVIRSRERDRDALAAQLNSRGVSTGLHYPVPVHLQNCYREWGYRAGSLPLTEHAAAEVLSLPMFPGLTPDTQQRVATELAAALHPRSAAALV